MCVHAVCLHLLFLWALKGRGSRNIIHNRDKTCEVSGISLYECVDKHKHTFVNPLRNAIQGN